MVVAGGITAGWKSPDPADLRRRGQVAADREDVPPRRSAHGELAPDITGSVLHYRAAIGLISQNPVSWEFQAGRTVYHQNMNYVVMAFRCEQCEARLEAHVVAKAGFGAGGHQATCPKCGKVQGSFPDQVIEVLEAPKEA